MTACVVGLAEIGVALATHYAQRGVPALVGGCRTLGDLSSEPDLHERAATALANGSLRLEPDVTLAARQSRAIVIAEPIAIKPDGQLDYNELERTVELVGRGLTHGSLVLIETTVAVGDTRRRIAPLLERASGLRPGSDFFLAHSPQRCTRGHVLADLRRYPKAFGGVEASSTTMALEFYTRVMETVLAPLQDCETSELLKLTESASRFVGLAMANEVALFAAAHGIDAVMAILIANTQPHFPVHQAGLGPLPEDVLVAAHLLGEVAGFEVVRAAERTWQRLIAALAGEVEQRVAPADAVVVILGAPSSYLETLRRRLLERYPRVSYAPSLRDCPRADVLIVARMCEDLERLYAAPPAGCRFVVDAINVLSPRRVTAMGLSYVGVGR